MRFGRIALFVCRRYLVTFCDFFLFCHLYRFSFRAVGWSYKVYYAYCILFATWFNRLKMFNAGNKFGGIFLKPHFVDKTRDAAGLILFLDCFFGRINVELFLLDTVYRDWIALRLGQR